MVDTKKKVTGVFGSFSRRAAQENLAVQWVSKGRLPIINNSADVLCKQIERDVCEIIPITLAGALFVSLQVAGA